MNDQANNHLNLGASKLILLGVSSILLSMSYVFSVFTPFPLGLAVAIYGKKKGFITIAVTFLFSLLISLFVFKSFVFAFVIFIAGIISLICSQTVMNNYNPVKSIALGGTSIIVILSAMFFAIVSSQNIDIKEYLIEEIKTQKTQMDSALAKEKIVSTDENVFDVQAFLSQPELVADYIIKELPGYFMMSVFLIIWFNLGLLARSRRITLYLMGQQNLIAKESLFNIRLPDQLVIVVALALAAVVFGDSLSESYVTLGMTALKVVGVFYFFQGFGIYIAFLNYARIQGFFRTLLIILTIFTAGQVLAIAGLLDTFFNFRKFLIKKK